jgi:hypothetical protein
MQGLMNASLSPSNIPCISLYTVSLATLSEKYFYETLCDIPPARFGKRASMTCGKGSTMFEYVVAKPDTVSR